MHTLARLRMRPKRPYRHGATKKRDELPPSHSITSSVPSGSRDGEGAWAGETFCTFKRKKHTAAGWDVVANCSNTYMNVGSQMFV